MVYLDAANHRLPHPCAMRLRMNGAPKVVYGWAVCLHAGAAHRVGDEHRPLRGQVIYQPPRGSRYQDANQAGDREAKSDMLRVQPDYPDSENHDAAYE